MSGSSLLASAATSAAGSAWSAHDTRLALCALAGIALVVLLTALWGIHPFLSLIAGSLLVGFSAGVPVDKVLPAFESGVGSVLGDVGVIVALGSMLGRLVVDSGGAERLVTAIVDRTGPRRAPWAMLLGAMVVGIPMFFEVGLVLLVPIVYLAWRRTGGSILRVGIPALAGLSILHGLIPPHPGPLIAVAALHADLGTTLLLGLLVAIPTAVIAGPLYGTFIAKRVTPQPPERMTKQYSAERDGAEAVGRGGAERGGAGASEWGVAERDGAEQYSAERGGAERDRAEAAERDGAGQGGAERDGAERDGAEAAGRGGAGQYGAEAAERAGGRTPGIATTLAVILLPVAIMLARTVVDLTANATSEIHRVADFVGDPITAMAIALVVALALFRFGRERSSAALADSLAPIAGILLIIGSGGGFKQMLITTGVADSIGKAAHHSHISLVLLAWLVAVAIRLATGSATVATVTASGIIAPIAATATGYSAPLLALAIGSGSLFLSHVNDAGFWLVKEFFGMDVKQTFKSWSAMETILSAVSIAVILPLSTVIH